MVESQKIVQDAYKVFKKRIVEIDYLQRVTSDVYQKTLSNLTKQIQTEQDNPQKSSDGFNFFLRNITSGILEQCELNIFSVSEKKVFVHELYNRQYQTLLVDAYEEFEKYLKTAYSELSKNHNKFFIQKFHNNNILIKFEPLKFLKRLHNEIPEIENIINLRNIENSRQPNIYMTLFLLALIEKLRHHIVHSQGFVLDEQKFTDDVFKNAGLSNNSASAKYYIDELSVYFGNDQYSKLICLLEVNVNAHQFHDRLGDLIRELVSYTNFINSYITRQLNPA